MSRYIVTVTYEDMADEFSESVEDTLVVEAANDGVARHTAIVRLLDSLQADNPMGDYRTEVVRVAETA